MKNWGWQQWVGKLLLFAVALVELLIKQLGAAIPWSAIILPAVVGLAQLVLGFVPGEGWAKAVGKILLWAIATAELALSQLGVSVPIWTVLAPMITALAQYLISLVPPKTA